jgi:hypothetical protein
VKRQWRESDGSVGPRFFLVPDGADAVQGSMDGDCRGELMRGAMGFVLFLVIAVGSIAMLAATLKKM